MRSGTVGKGTEGRTGGMLAAALPRSRAAVRAWSASTALRSDMPAWTREVNSSGKLRRPPNPDRATAGLHCTQHYFGEEFGPNCENGPTPLYRALPCPPARMKVNWFPASQC